MLTYETLGHMIIQELVNIRNDFRSELERLGDRLESCLTVHPIGSINKSNLTVGNELKDHEFNGSTVFVTQSNPVHSDTRIWNSCTDKPGIKSKDNALVLADCTDTNVVDATLSITPLNLDTSPKKLDSHYVAKISNQNAKERHQARERTAELAAANPKSSELFSLLTNQDSSNRLPVIPKVEVYPDDSFIPTIVEVSNHNKVSSDENLGKTLSHPSVANMYSHFNIDKNSRTQKRNKKFINTNIEKRSQKKMCHKYMPFQFKRHLNTHLAVKPHACTVCNKTFVRSSALRRHMRIHKLEYCSACKECGEMFRTKAALNSHLQTDHCKRAALSAVANCGKDKRIVERDLQ